MPSTSATAGHTSASPFRQPRAVWAVAFACVIGINNTLTTQAVMLVSPVDRPVASAAYGFIRFIGGGLAPFAAGLMAEHRGVHVPFYVGAAAVLLAIGVLRTGHSLLATADERLAQDEAAHAERELTPRQADLTV